MQIHITNTIDPEFGGEGMAAKGLSEAISKFNINVLLISRSGVNIINNKPNLNPFYSIIYFRKNFFLFQIIKDFFRLIYIFNRYNPKVVHIHGMWTIFLAMAAFLCIFKRIRYIVSPHGCLEPWALNHKKTKKKLAMILYQKQILDNASCLVVNSRLELLNAQKLKLNVPIAIIQNAISVIPDLRKKSFKNPKTLLFFSRIHEKKGVDYLLKAWSICDTKNWKLKIVGPGNIKYVTKLKKLIKDLNISKKVELRHGFVSNKIKQEIFTSAHGFVLPTRSENFGIVVVEALSNQLPVITTQEAPWEELSEFKCGWWIPANVRGVALAIQEIINTPSTDLKKMGIRGYNLAKKNYTWDSKGKQGHDLYYWLLDKKINKPVFIFNNNSI